MHIENYLNVIDACRFCFMCRHLDPVGNVTFREADTPRGRALMCDRIRMDAANLSNADYIDAFYRSALSAANRFHCVSDYDETGLVLAVRRDIVEADLAPAAVKALAKTLEKDTFSVKGKGRVLYFGPTPELYKGCAVITGGDPGKALAVLGFEAASKKVFTRFKKAVSDSGCKTLIVAEPSAFEFLHDRLPDVKVIHSAAYFVEQGMNKTGSRKAVYLESDFLKNTCGNPSAPRDLLKQLGYKLVPFGTNVEESYAVGEGALVYDTLYPELAERLCQRVYTLAEGLAKTRFITASQTVKDTLKKYNPAFDVVTLEEAVALSQA